MSKLEPIGLPANDPANRRIHSRRRIESTPTTVDLGGENGGIILDLSEGGVGVQAVLPVIQRPTIPIHFELLDTQISVDVVTEIAWGANSKQVGLRFLQLPARVRDELRSWLSDHRNFDGAIPPRLEPLLAQLGPGAPNFSNLPLVGGNALAMELKKLQAAIISAGIGAKTAPSEIPPARSRGQTGESNPEARRAGALPKGESLAETTPPVIIRRTPAAAPHTSIAPNSTPLASLRIELPLHDIPATLAAAAQKAEALAKLWRSQPFLKRLQSMNVTDRKRAFYELEFQIRALSLWLWELGIDQPSQSPLTPGVDTSVQRTAKDSALRRTVDSSSDVPPAKSSDPRSPKVVPSYDAGQKRIWINPAKHSGG